METGNYNTTFTVKQSPEQVFNAVNNVRGWWSEQIEGRTDALDEEFKYQYQDVHQSRIKIIEFIPNRKVVWLIVDNYFSFIKDKSEWIGTQISFDIKENANSTELRFMHIGLVSTYECYDICTDAWTNYVQGSLKQLIQTGIGNPNPYQIAVDKAEAMKSEVDYTQSFLVGKAPGSVFNAINDIGKWWSTNLKGSSLAVGDEFEVRFGDIHYSRHKIVESVPFQRIVWLVTESKLNFVDTHNEWTGTYNVFEIGPEDGKTRVTFRHLGLRPDLKCFANCSKGWDQYIIGSLFPYILNGQGHPWV
jgi:hypothetical protein